MLRKFKSSVWHYFTVCSDETKAMCHLCGKLLSRGGCGKNASTSPLLSHLKSMHMKELQDKEKSCIDLVPKNDELRKSWLNNMQWKCSSINPRAKVCEKHFDPSCIYKKKVYIDEFGVKQERLRLKATLHDGSLPTIFDATTAELPVIKKRRRRILLQKRRKNWKKRQIAKEQRDSMPLQQRLDSIAGNSIPEKVDNKPPPLKSQPLSPTKLKVTRQSTSKSIPEVTPPPDNSNEEVCLRWNSHHSNMQSAFPSLLSKEQYCDVTLVAEGKSLKCHKLILSSCSPYFDQVLENIMPYHHPIIFMKDIPFNILKSLCDFMYAGEVNIIQGDLNHLLAVAESLKIKGLANKTTSNSLDHTSSPDESKETKELNQTQKSKETPLSRFVKIAPKPSGVADQKFDLPKGGSNADVTDPLDLMEPTYEEEATVDMPPQLAVKKTEPTRRSLGKRVRKRKYIGDEDHESSPPVFQSRKGTRSRPNVKVPRYFNASFDNSNEKPTSPETTERQQETGIDPCAEPLLELLEEIKTEPVDIEDSMIEESYDTVRSTSTRLMDVVIAKEEKEDDPDPLNVEPCHDSLHRHPEGYAPESSNLYENSELCNHMENPNSSDKIENSDTFKLTENLESNDPVESCESSVPTEKFELTDHVEALQSGGLTKNSKCVSKNVTLECQRNESRASPENGSQLLLSLSETFNTPKELPENIPFTLSKNETESVEQVAVECLRNENRDSSEDNSHLLLSSSKTCNTSKDLPENDKI